MIMIPHEHVLKQSYNCLKELKELGKCNWCTYVHEITIETGFEGAWESQILDKKTFGLIKENFKQEIYLSEIKDYRYIIALARFRISSHNLKIPMKLKMKCTF